MLSGICWSRPLLLLADTKTKLPPKLSTLTSSKLKLLQTKAAEPTHNDFLQSPQKCHMKAKSDHSDLMSATNSKELNRRRQLFAAIAAMFFAIGSDSAFAGLEKNGSENSKRRKSIFDGLLNTQSWDRFKGDGFSLRIPPDFEDIMIPEDSDSSSLYGQRAKPRTFAARFASPDGSEVLSVVIKPSSAVKITFLEARDISDLGSLRDAVKLFVPGGATVHAARTIKAVNSETPRTYYYYEFSAKDEHVALEASVSRGKVFVVGATSPQSKWEKDGAKLRSAALSFSLT
eukprot:TRINITY_DN21160_c0_g1_i1.p1 TRINITY_DN21160_c0_g1~~TRINITY_DN21160_c0_g1_i1.p1  ORF type:complete len:288 (-),score=57.94 TRINITY_DN21160_c0_g1_i1:123-986(-)